MCNKNYDDIKIPKNIDDVIEQGVARAMEERRNRNNKKRIRVMGKVAAGLGVMVTLGVANPALATKLPIVGGVFESIEKNVYFPGNYSEYATSINETVYSRGIGITLSEVLCDGQSLYVTYKVESDEPFKNTSWNNGGKMDMNQLIIEEAYNRVNFSSKELDNTGFAGLEGKFIDERTFVGVQKYHLDSLETNVPDEFEFKTKIKYIENYNTEDESKNDIRKGTWAFKVPVKVNKDLKKVVEVEDVESDIAKLNSVSTTPFGLSIDVSYKEGEWHEYEVCVTDENGQSLQMEMGSSYGEDNKNERIYFGKPLDDVKEVKVTVSKPELTLVDSAKGAYEQTGSKVVLEGKVKIK